MMKHIFLAAGAVLLFACGQTGKPAASQEAPAADTTQAVAAVSDKFPDPVCGMPYDTSYKESMVFHGDTLHFCSVTCKDVFSKAPEKFMAKLKH
ncbi:YHS domain-containing protein [Chitinophaga nivalis]|uniref:YHS domain-containing protein n=1 Tax=Chitinophaga nivalis TaxID=2991709 RepID=A0ABT3IUL9_9BACT|nr:YHS domain-containing protein [Chitinophaga nivalis]MCW3462921.1 YHS domain-containing protein [Chitinophaga nivalis]MCW3487389.1 YHS domain-containing protein [Chitinophaga nivalis]